MEIIFERFQRLTLLYFLQLIWSIDRSFYLALLQRLVLRQRVAYHLRLYGFHFLAHGGNHGRIVHALRKNAELVEAILLDGLELWVLVESGLLNQLLCQKFARRHQVLMLLPVNLRLDSMMTPLLVVFEPLRPMRVLVVFKLVLVRCQVYAGWEFGKRALH